MNGIPTRVAWCLSKRQTAAEAIEDLRRREGTKTDFIGIVSADGRTRCRDQTSCGAINAWAAEKAIEHIVWTDLPSNFHATFGEPFSVDAAMRYLRSLKGPSIARAIEYINRAPSFVQTPLRKAYGATKSMGIGEITGDHS